MVNRGSFGPAGRALRTSCRKLSFEDAGTGGTVKFPVGFVAAAGLISTGVFHPGTRTARP